MKRMHEVTAGIDIGGTDTEIGLVDINGECYKNATIITANFSDAREFINECINVVNSLSKEKEEFKIKAIGIAAPNGNHYKGTIDHPVNLAWKGIIPFTEIMQEYTKLPVVLTNDANAAAIGEKMFGGAKDMNDFILVTLGTGLGSGIYAGGRLLLGHSGLAGEMGHMIMEENGRTCNSQRKGCLEAYASVTGIRRTVFSLLAKSNEKSSLRKWSFEELSGEEITEAAKQNDPIALEAFDFTGRVLGIGLANVVNLFDPEAVFMAGGLARAEDFILKPAKKYMEENVLPVFQNKVEVAVSALLNKSGGVLGAAALAWDKLNVHSKV